MPDSAYTTTCKERPPTFSQTSPFLLPCQWIPFIEGPPLFSNISLPITMSVNPLHRRTTPLLKPLPSYYHVSESPSSKDHPSSQTSPFLLPCQWIPFIKGPPLFSNLSLPITMSVNPLHRRTTPLLKPLPSYYHVSESPSSKDHPSSQTSPFMLPCQWTPLDNDRPSSQTSPFMLPCQWTPSDNDHPSSQTSPFMLPCQLTPQTMTAPLLKPLPSCYHANEPPQTMTAPLLKPLPSCYHVNKLPQTMTAPLLKPLPSCYHANDEWTPSDNDHPSFETFFWNLSLHATMPMNSRQTMTTLLLWYFNGVILREGFCCITH